jgi:hypothetical protein
MQGTVVVLSGIVWRKAGDLGVDAIPKDGKSRPLVGHVAADEGDPG